MWRVEGEEDEAVGESVARGVWSHEGRRSRVSCPAPTTPTLCWRKGIQTLGLASFEFLIVWMEYCNPLLDETNKMDGYWKFKRGNHNWLELGVLGIFNCWEGGRKQTNQSDYNGQLPIQYKQYQMFE